MGFELFIFIVLIILTGFFVATEFAIVKIRSSRVEQLVLEGKKGALSAKEVVSHLDEYLSACQLGITVTALGIGMVGESTFGHLVDPVLEFLGIPSDWSKVITIGFAFIMATYLHVVVGELAPKSFALAKAEKITLLFSKPIIIFYKLMYPFIWLLNGSARLIVGLFGIQMSSETSDDAHSEDEIKILLKESSEQGEIDEFEHDYVKKVFEFDDKLGKEVMVPRNEVVMIESNICYDNLIKIINEEAYTRYPVYKDDKDKIIGYINTKDLFKFNTKSFSLDKIIKPIPHIIDTVSLGDLLRKLQSDRSQIAMLIDEYGGVSGLITMEDILEELVGEIRDEYDIEEEDEINMITNEEGLRIYEVDGKALISDLEKELNVEIANEEEINTIGGLFLVKEENEFIIENYRFILKEKDGMHIKKILIQEEMIEELKNE